MTWVFDGTLSRSIAAGSGRAVAAGVGCCGAAVVLVAGARRGCAARAGNGVVEITSTVGRATGCCAKAGAWACAAAVKPIVVATATAVDRNRPFLDAIRLLMTLPRGSVLASFDPHPATLLNGRCVMSRRVLPNLVGT